MEPNSQTAAAAAGVSMIAFAILGVLVIVMAVCWIKVLIALFKKEGAGLGILGILCNIYAFIWGWIKSTELGLKKTMLVWTLSIVPPPPALSSRKPWKTPSVRHRSSRQSLPLPQLLLLPRTDCFPAKIDSRQRHPQRDGVLLGLTTPP
jgi:hypothetical protein